MGIGMTDENELTLSDLVTRAWQLRGAVVVILLASILFAAAWVFGKAANFNTPVQYYVTLRNIENSRFQNGAAFSPGDLLIPQVIAGLRKRFHIPDDVPLKDYLAVDYGSPLASAVSEKYQMRLAERNLSQVELEAINTAYKQELEATMRSGLRIDVNYAGLGVDKETGSAIAVAIPQLWSDIYSKQFRIFIDPRLQGAAVTMTPEKLDTSASVLTADTRLKSMTAGIKILSGDNRLSSMTTHDGLSFADLSAQIAQFYNIYFYPILSGAREEGDFVFASYMRERLLTLADLQRKLAGLDQTISDLREFQGKVSSARNNPPQGGIGTGGEGVQLADGALNQIIELTNRASLVDYVKGVFKDRQEMVEETSALQMEIDRLQEATQSRSSPEFRSAAATELAKLTASYQELLSSARTRMTDMAGELYVPQSGPTTATSLVSFRNLLAFPFALAVGGILSLLLVLLWPARRAQRPPMAKLESVAMNAAE